MSQGDALFAELFAGSRHALSRYVRRFVRSRDTAEEIVQEAFLRTYEHAATVKTPHAFLFSTARNLAIDLVRHERISRTETLADFEALGIVCERDTPESTVLADERAQVLRDAIGGLPPQCRAALALKVFHACSYKEIAEKLGISTKTVEHHIARGMREIHERLCQHSAEIRNEK